MKKELRQKEILDMLQVEGMMSPHELTERLYMSLSTVYRDIRDLENQHLLIRTAEGRVAYPGEQGYIPAPHKRNISKDAKIAIARQAVALIPPGATVHFDSSSTVSYMIEFLSGRRNITVLTSSIYIARMLIAEHIPAYFCGGKLLENSQTLGGRINQLLLSSMNVDYMFFSPHAIDEKGIIFDSVENSSRRNAFTHAKYSVCLCDSTKFGKVSLFRAASVRDIDYLITNAVLPADYAQPRIGLLSV